MPAEKQKTLLSLYGSEAAYRKAYDEAQQNMTAQAGVLRASEMLYTIEGSDHMQFSDIGLFIGARPLREWIGIRGKFEHAGF